MCNEPLQTPVRDGAHVVLGNPPKAFQHGNPMYERLSHIITAAWGVYVGGCVNYLPVSSVLAALPRRLVA